MRRISGIGIFAFVTLLLPVTTEAATLDFTGMGHRSVVTVGGPIQGTFYAGELNWSWTGEVPSGFEASIYTYCVDIMNALTDPQQVTVRSSDLLTASAADAGGKAAWLFNTFAPGIRQSGTGTQAAALQVAIWEALYDNTANLASGAFSLVTSAGVYGGQANALAIANQANSYLQQLFSAPGGGYNTGAAVWLDATAGGQDQITRVVEPSVLVLLGLAAVAVARRRGTVYSVDA